MGLEAQPKSPDPTAVADKTKSGKSPRPPLPISKKVTFLIQVAEQKSAVTLRCLISPTRSPRHPRRGKSDSTALENARVQQLATLAEVVPHLAGLPPAQFEQGLAVLAEVDPPAFQTAMNILGRQYQIAQAQQQDQQQRAYLQRQHFEAQRQQYNRATDQALGMTFSEKAEMAEELVASVEKYGISRDQLMQEARTESGAASSGLPEVGG